MASNTVAAKIAAVVILVAAGAASCAAPGAGTESPTASSLSANTSVQSSSVVVSPQDAPSLVAWSEDWKKKGAELIESKAKIKTDNPSVINGGAWAFMSRPFDVTSDGEYQMVFDVTDLYPELPDKSEPTAFSFDFPGDQRFTISPAEGPVLSRSGTSTLLTASIKVSNIRASYPVFSVWVY